MLRVSDSGLDVPKATLSDRAEGAGDVAKAAYEAELLASVKATVDQLVAVACADASGRITFANRAFCRLSGYTAEELLGRHRDAFCSVARRRELCQTLARGETWKGELEQEAKEGGRYWVAATIAPLTGSALPGGQYICICTDITDAKRAALEQLELQQELLRQSDEQYAHAASHDLQEPLRAIVGCGQMLQECAPHADPTVNQLIAHGIEGGKRMQRLVLALLAYARLGTHGPRLAPVASREVFAQAIAPLATAIQESAAEVDAQDLPTLLADSQQLAELFRQLVSNALTYRSARRPTIRVRAVREGAFLTFSVADNGIGIDPSSHRRVFMLFSRLHARHEHPGQGIGLSLCKKIVERHGGRMWLESEPGRGATFFFTLPARLPPARDQFQ